MDHHATLTHPLQGVFRRLATPACLGDWLPEVTEVQAGLVPPGLGDPFSLALGRERNKVPATGELIAFEPPWLVAYRLLSGSRVLVLRVTCTSGPGVTTVHVHQSEELFPLGVDLDRLGRVLDMAGGAAPAPSPAPHLPQTEGTNSDG
jgi:uncharacterized protein YndB with AHSA1/START domain